MDYRIADPLLYDKGERKLTWAWQHMDVLQYLRELHIPVAPLQGETIAACLHLEAKTACLLKVLQDLGATVVAAGSNPLSTQDDICAALVKAGVHVFSRRGMSNQEYADNLEALVHFRPSIVIDDGADLIALIHEKYSSLIPSIKGGCEETTTGVTRLRAMAKEGVLGFPVIAVNDAKSKFLFDNRYGTGQSVMDGIMRTTNLLLAGKKVVVAGYGWCGRGVAMRASAMGSRVIVVETDPHRAFEAMMDGFDVMSMLEASERGDIFLTLTGNTRVIRKEHFTKMHDGVLLANAGHFDVEIDRNDLEELSTNIDQVRENIETYVMKDGRKLHLLAMGRLVNLAAGDGHPVEIMDLSFGIQLLSTLYISRSDSELQPGVMPLPENLDQEVMKIKLRSLQVELESMTPEQEAYIHSWKE